jgi:hypothetical protein
VAVRTAEIAPGKKHHRAYIPRPIGKRGLQKSLDVKVFHFRAGLFLHVTPSAGFNYVATHI